MERVDVIIVGQGLAGTALAWQLLRRGQSVLVLDQEPRFTSSRIAAGLITPITGKRLAVNRDLLQLLPVATEFYRGIETELGVHFFHELPCVRLFAYEIELKQYARSEEEFAGLVCEPSPDLNPDWFHAPRGGFEMPAAARLDTATYLNASRAHWTRTGTYLTAKVDITQDISVTDVEITWLPGQIRASCLIFCQGYPGIENPYFPEIRFNAAKGEILTLRIPGLGEKRVINRGVWLAPDGNDLWRAGATYSWDPLDCEPTESGRTEILTRLSSFLKLPVEVVSHAAAVRPIIEERHPVIAWNSQYPRLGFFNGLGSKGSLLAPHFAALCAEQCLSLTGQSHAGDSAGP